MGTTSQKLTYLAETKTQLKDMINYGLDTGEKITSETTFRNYVKSLFDAFIKTMTYPDVLYNNLPKVTGEGTSLTLNDTVYAPMRVELSPSALEQESTSISGGDEYDSPSPEHPQQIHTVSGENTITIENKNLLNRENCIEDGILAWANGTPVYSSTYENSLISNYIRVELNQTYSFNHSASMFFYDKSKNYLGALQNDNTTIAKNSGKVATGLTIPNISEIYYMRLSFRASSTSPDYTITDMMVNKGTTLLDYVPHQEQTYPISLDDLEYCKIGEYEDLFMKPSGKNLFDKDSATTEVGYFKSDGTIVSGGSSTITTSYTKIVPNTDMVFSGITPEYVCFYDENKNFIERVSGITTFNKNAYYIRFQETTSSLNLDNIQLEVGTTPTPYEPYDNGKWYLKKNIKKLVLNGTENWGITGSGTDNWFYRFAYTSNIASGGVGLSNYYQWVGITSTNTAKGTYVVGGYVRIRYGTEDTVENLKTWLSTNNVTLYYQLATPTYTLLSDTLQTQLEAIWRANSYEDQTNVSQENNDLPFVIKMSAIRDLSGIFELIQG